MSEEFTNEEQAEAIRQIEEWKEIYQSVYVIEISDVPFVFRGLSRAEHRKAVEWYEDDYDRAEFVCRTCVLDPADVDYSEDIYAGIPETLTEAILEYSGFGEDTQLIDNLMNKYDNEMNTFNNQLSCVIVEAFPYLDIEDVENWSIEKTMWYFSRAKWVLQALRGIELERTEVAPTEVVGGAQVVGDKRDFPELELM